GTAWGLRRAWQGRSSAWGLPLAALAVALFVTLLLGRAHTALTQPWAGLVDQLTVWEQPDDVVLLNRPEDTVAFAEGSHSRLWVVGLNEGEGELSPRAAWWLERLLEPGARLWWIPNWLPPERSAVERELMMHAYRALDLHEGDLRLALYVVPAAQMAEQPLGIPWAEGITLESAAWPDAAAPGDALPVRLRWQAAHPPQDDLVVYLHLLDAAGVRLAGHDAMPQLWLRPTSTWHPGERIEDRHAFCLPPTLPPGTYTLRVGLYRADGGEQLPTASGDEVVRLGTVQVLSSPAP
ncbi:MAG: hypothetical protein GX605_12840, partial [Chloroflexi bacterium]|nr:hypothetical protein [Chloroflexota bacterium]